MKSNFFNLDLQYFADDVEISADVEEVADLPEETTDEDVDVDGVYEDEDNDSEVEVPEAETTSKQEFKNEQNAAFANMRRKAEADAQAKFDAKIAKLCQGYTHPVTGKPITTFADYEDALYQQDKLAAEKRMAESGIDPNLLNNVIANNPVIKEAQAVIESTQKAEADRKLQAEFAEIQKIDPMIKSIQDIPNLDQIVNMVQGGTTFLNAYKVANFDRVMSNAKASGKQSAINQVKGKSHMTGVDSLTENTSDVDVPKAEYMMYKEMFPNKSAAEIKKLYNTTIKKLGGK